MTISLRITPCRNNVFRFVLFLILAVVTRSEIRKFEGPLDAAPDYIHFSEGYLVAPGYVDISGLRFSNNDNGQPSDISAYKDYDFNLKNNAGDLNSSIVNTGDGGLVLELDDDAAMEFIDDEVDDDEDDHNGGGRKLIQREMQYGINMIDVVLFHEPKECANTRAGCDWSKLGVGASNDIGDVRWCCSKDAIALGLCQGRPGEFNRLIINRTRFEGHVRNILVPRTGYVELEVQYGQLEEVEFSGKYFLVMANCNPDGRNMTVEGTYVWKSKGGYLPGNMFGVMYFLFFLTVVYGVLFTWYAISMKVHQESTIPIQNWILGTIGLGLLESFFKGGDYWVWNEEGTHFLFAMYTGVLIGILKRALSWCLMVMVSLGWGVVRDTLTNMKKIVSLGIIYAIASAAMEIIEIFDIVENEVMSEMEKTGVMDVLQVLTFVVVVINVFFFMWILDALSGTMQYLENLNQNSKLMRYLRLRLILILSIFLSIVWVIFNVVNENSDIKILDEGNAWVAESGIELNYLMVMITVALLWQPNPSAKEYAYVMELPSIDDDIELTEEDGMEMIETNAGVLQQGEGKDEDDFSSGDGQGLKIDDAVGA